MLLHLTPGILINGALFVPSLGLCSPFYLVCFALHSGIACLASQASDWAGALWYSLSGLWLATHC